MRARPLLVAFAALACGPQVPTGVDGTTGGGTSTGLTASSTSAADEDVDEGPVILEDVGSADDTSAPRGCGRSDNEPCKLDILVVVDNSGGMADPQIALTRALVQLVERLEQHDGETSLIVDVQIMFTTTDMSAPLCEPYQPPHYTPAMGAPTTTACNARIDDFVGLGGDPDARYEACTDACPFDIEPSDPFVAFVGVGVDNVPNGTAAQAVGCLAPQGINGCGYEQPLEAMVQALDPSAEWNSGDRPFLREESVVMIIIATDETDCSMDDPGWMMDPKYLEAHNGSLQVSSAICWNAGMACGQADADGIYSDCVLTESPLQPISRYTTFLANNLVGHEVTMIASTGVPLVRAVNPNAPFEPTEGGVDDLVLREWREGAYPEGDIVPEDAKNGVDASDKTWEFKAGPGCTEPVPTSDRFVQAIRMSA